MISINYQAYGSKFGLRLRLYKDREVKYISVNKLLQGSLSKKHWNQRKQQFIPSAPFSKENNEILAKFKYKYEKRAIDWTGSLADFMVSFNTDKDIDAVRKPTMHELFERIIAELKERKHPDGTVKGTYEGYEKCERRIQEFCALQKIDYSKLKVEDVTGAFISKMFHWIHVRKKGKSFLYVSKMLHATFARAEKYGWYDIGKLKHVEWAKKPLASSQKNRSLTPEQCSKLVHMPPRELPQNRHKLLYRDFCVFLLYTGQSPCDAVALRYSDIQNIRGVDHFVFKRRKIAEKQAVPCTVPINDVMRQIMKRWKSESKDGYIFPIRTKAKLKHQKVENGDIKHLVSRLNIWLKELGKVLGCDFPLHIYTFRHTAITNYISNGIPVVYVANMMGTSVKNCERIYYNNQGDTASMDKVLNMPLF